MGLDKVSDNAVVTGSDGGRSAANLNYILYILGFFTAGISALVGVVLAYSNRETASDVIRSHFDWQIKLFWRSVKFWVVLTILYLVFTVVAVVTLGVGFILYVIPIAIGIWWLVSTITRIVRGMKALGLGQPVALAAGAHSVPLLAPTAVASQASTPSMPPAGWYDDAERPGRTRWWDGTAWGMRDDEHPSAASAARPSDAAGAEGTPRHDAEPANEVASAPDPGVVPTHAELEPVVASGLQPVFEALPAATTSPTPEPAAMMSPSQESAADGAPEGRFCESCGAERRPGARFCSSCGHAH